MKCCKLEHIVSNLFNQRAYLKIQFAEEVVSFVPKLVQTVLYQTEQETQGNQLVFK